MAAFVGHTGFCRTIGQVPGLGQGQSIHVRPEPDGGFPVPLFRFIQGIEPAAPVHQLQMGMMADEIHQPFFCFLLLTGQFRMGMEGVAKLQYGFPVGLGEKSRIHRSYCSFLFRFPPILLQIVENMVN